MRLMKSNRLYLNYLYENFERGRETNLMTQHEVFWSLSPDLSETLFISPAYQEVWGQDPERLYEDPISVLEAVHPEDQEKVHAALKASMEDEVSLEFRVVHPTKETRWLRMAASPIKTRDNETRRIVTFSEDITEPRRRSEEQKFLTEASALLYSSLDYKETLEKIAHLAVPRIADWCGVDMLENGEIQRVAVAHSDSTKRDLAREVGEKYPPDVNASTGAGHVLRTGESELFGSIPESAVRAAAIDERHLKILLELGLKSAMIVPMIAHDKIHGAISFVSAESGIEFDEHDLRFAQELATRAALAVDNSRLYTQAESAHREVSEILNSITDAFFSVNHDWEVRYLNEGAKQVLSRVTKINGGKIVGSKLWDVVPGLLGTVIEQKLRSSLNSSEQKHFEEFEPAWSSWLEVHVYPSREGLSVFFRDITERKRAEEGLQLLAKAGSAVSSSLDYEKTLQTIAELTTETMADYCFIEILDEDKNLRRMAAAHKDPGKQDWLNQSKNYPSKPDSPFAKALAERKPVLIPELSRESAEKMAQDGEHKRIIQHLKASSLLAVPLVARNKSIGLLYLATAESNRRYTEEDVSVASELGRRTALAIDNARLFNSVEKAREEAEARAHDETMIRSQLEQVLDSRSRLMRGFSHDLKNPIGAADAYLQLMEEGIMGELTEKQMETLASARRSINAGLKLITDLLDFARAESGDISVNRCPTDLTMVGTEIVHEYKAKAESEGLDLKLSTQDGLPLVHTDEDRIKQIIGNLITNSLKYTEKGYITIEVGKSCDDAPHPGEWLYISVSDTGLGISEEEQELLFQEFRRLRSSDKVDGAGIGLAISRRIAHALEGEITMTSKEGEGSTFTLWLPLRSEDSPQESDSDFLAEI